MRFGFTDCTDAPVTAFKGDDVVLVGNINLLEHLEEADRHLPTGDDEAHMRRMVEALVYTHMKNAKQYELESKGMDHRRAVRKAEWAASAYIRKIALPVLRSNDIELHCRREVL